MTTDNYTTVIMTADEGFMLTQSSEDIGIIDRIVAERVALGKYSTVNDWKEITKEEADQIIAEQNTARQAVEAKVD